MRRLLGVLALVALALIAVALIAGPPAVLTVHAADAAQAVQDPAQDTLTAQEEAPPLAPLPQLVADLAEIAAKIDEVETNLAEAPAENQAVFVFQRRRRWQEHHEVLGRLVEGIDREQDRAAEDSLARAEADSLVADADSLVIAEARSALQLELVTIEVWVSDLSAEAATILRALAVAPPTDLVRTEIELHRRRTDIDDLFLALTENYERAVVLGLDLSAEQSLHEAAVVERTELVGAALEQALEEQADYRDWITKPGVDTIAMGLQIAASEERVLGATESLQAMVALVAGIGMEVSDYRRLIVTATGDIGIVEVLDVQVVGGLIAQWSEEALVWFEANIGTIILRLLTVVMVLLLARLLSAVVRTVGRRFLSSKRVDLSSLVRNLVISGLANLVWIVAFFVMLSLVGIDLGPMLAGLGIAGFVIGFALQDTLSNFASGLMIMVYRPFDVGDWVTAGGVSGEVKNLTLVSTVISTVDNKRVTIPNGKVWGDVINNANAEEIRRVDVVFNISHSGDVDLGLSVLRDILANEERVLEDPEPAVKVKKLEEFSVQLLCAPWCKTEDYWGLYWDLNRLIKKRFDAEGVLFPFPQMDGHVRHEGAGSSPGSSAASGEN